MLLEIQSSHAMTAVVGILFFIFALFDFFDWTKICQRFHFHPVAAQYRPYTRALCPGYQ